MRTLRMSGGNIPRTTLRWIGNVCSIAVVATLVGWGQVATTTVQDTVFNADGSYAAGTILISWPAFATSTGNTVAAGKISTQIGANGQVVLNLAPNAGASPAGSYYTAVYHLSDGVVSKEYWSIPSVPSTSIAAIRSLIMPASVAVQTLSATEVNSMLAKYLPLDGGTLNGALQLPGDPQTGLQAATKSYVDASVAPLASAVTQAISAAPASSQTVRQPAGTSLSSNVLQGKYYASGFTTNGQSNGIANLAGSSNCANGSPSSSSGCTIIADPSYPSAEKPQGTNSVAIGLSANYGWPMNTHLHDERNGVTADYYENPFSMSPFQQSGELKSTAYTLDFQKWPAYSADNVGTEVLNTADYEGGYNFDNYYVSEPSYFFKTYYTNLVLNTTNYSSGQQQAINNNVNCHGTGDCLAMSTFVTCDGGVNAGNDEGCHGGDFNISEDPTLYSGTMNAATAVGATLFATNCGNGCGTEGQDRLLLDTTAGVLTGTSITGYAGALPTGSNPNSSLNPDMAIDTNASFPVSTMVQLCYAGNDNNAGGAAGCTAGSQPVGVIPAAPNMINPSASVTTNVVSAYTATAPATGLPAGFCTPSTLQSSNSAAACYLPASGTACISDQQEYESVDYTYNSTAQTITLLNLRFPHANGVFFAHGGLCGYAAEQQSDVFTGDGNNNAISQVFPVLGSPNATSFYYISQRTNEGYTQPVLGLSNEQGGNATTGGGECINAAVVSMTLQSDGHTVQVLSYEDYNLSDSNFAILNGLPITVTTPNSTYNGTYTASFGNAPYNSGQNYFSYYLPTTPSGAAPTSGTASFCNTNYKLYPSVRVNSVLNHATNRVDGTMNTMPAPIAFAQGDSVKMPHYPWIYTGHDIGRGINQYQPRFYNAGYLYGMTYNFLLSGKPFEGFAIGNATDQDKYLRYGGTHEVPGFAYLTSGSWLNDFTTQNAPDNAVLDVQYCKPNPIGCNNINSAFDVIQVPGPNGPNADRLNYDPKSDTWTFGNSNNPNANPPIPATGTLAAYKMSATNVGVGGAYLFNLGGAVGLTSTPASPVFNNWYANYAYGFGPQNTRTIDTYLYRGASGDSVDCGTGTGDTSCTFTAGTVSATNVSAATAVSSPSLTVGGGSAVTHISYYATAAITPTAVAAGSCSDQAFAVSGLTTADELGSISPPGQLGNVSLDGYASAANTVTLHFCAVSSLSVTPPAGIYKFLAMH